MVLKNSDFISAKEGMQDLLAKNLPVKAALKLVQTVNKMEDVLKDFDKVRKDLIAKYKIDEKTDQASQEFVDFLKEYQELLDCEIQWDTNKVILPEIVRGEPLEVSAKTLMQTSKFVEVQGNT
jgi:hypothetical protein